MTEHVSFASWSQDHEEYRPKAYIGGPITGYENGNEKEFRKAGAWVERLLSHTPVIPHDVPPHEHGSTGCPEADSYPGVTGSHAGLCHPAGGVSDASV